MLAARASSSATVAERLLLPLEVLADVTDAPGRIAHWYDPQCRIDSYDHHTRWSMEIFARCRVAPLAVRFRAA
jgi:hypothetical protein